ncbi:MAG: PAS domain S-box protein [Ilumatobacteraceae bacterium]
MTTSFRSLDPSPEGRSALVNRSTLRRVLESAQSKGRGVGVVYLDVDRFHQINSRWGRTAGDRVLDVLGPRLAARLPDGGVITATEGDAYLAVLPAADPISTRAVADQLLEAVREAIEFAEITLSVGASAGFSHHAGNDRTVDLVEQAFLACRRAKATARGTAIAYESALGADVAWHQRTEDGLRRAIADGQLRMYIQPVIDLRDGLVSGVEALVRWHHPDDGLLLPGDFLPVAEAAGLMSGIGDWVLNEALRVAARWRREQPDRQVRIWVNLAAQQLAEGDRLSAIVGEHLDRGDIGPGDIGFEVTESSLLEDLPGAVDVLSGLRDLGVEIALDDFGTGYSSLSYLRRLPVTAVKIDRVFVAGIGGSLADEAIVEAVIDLAHALGLRVVAEGIEDEIQVDALVRMGADEAQGFHFAEPGSVADIERLLDSSWGHAEPPHESTMSTVADIDRRADGLPGFGSPRARLLLTALDTAHDSIVVTSASRPPGDGPPIVYVNAAFEAETGWSARDVIGKSLEFLLADPSAEVLAEFAQLHAAGRSTTAEFAQSRANGSTFLCEVTLSPIVDGRGVHTHWLHVRRDLTTRRAAEADLTRFQGLIDDSASLVILTESGGQWIYVNAAQRRVLGMTPDEPLDGMSTFTMYDADRVAQIAEVVLPALERDGHWSGPSSYVNRVTGEVTEVENDVRVMPDPLRPGVRIFATIGRDVTALNRSAASDRRRRELGEFAARLAQRALDEELDEMFANVFSILAPFAELLDADLAYLDAIDLDAGLLRPLGDWTSDRYSLPLEPPRLITLSELPHWVEHLQRPRGALGSTTDEVSSEWADELRTVFGVHPGGSNLYAPLHVGNRLVGVLGLSAFPDARTWTTDEIDMVRQVADTLANLIARQQSQDALRANEVHLEAMLANVKDVLVVIDPTGVIQFVNDALDRVLGLLPTDAIGHHFLDFVHPDDHELALENFAETVRIRDERSLFELRLAAPDGRSAWFEVTMSGEFDDVLEGFVLTLRDVNVRRQAVEAAFRRESYERIVLGVARWALDTEFDEPLAGLDDHLRLLGEAIGCDAVTVSLHDQGSVAAEAFWRNPLLLADPAASELVPRPVRSPALVERYREAGPFVVNDIDLIDEPWAAECRSATVTWRSAVHVPLVSGDRCLGDIGVAMLTEPREWTSEEISLFQRISETLASLLIRQRIEVSLRASEAQMGALLNGSHDLVVVVDGEGILRFANGAVERRLGYRPEELVGRNVSVVVHPDDFAEALLRLGTLHSSQPTMMITVRLITATGSVGWWEITSGASSDQIMGGLVLICREVTSRRRVEQEHAARIEHLRYAFGLAQSALDVGTQQFLAQLDSFCGEIAELLAVDTVYVDRLDERHRRLVNQGISNSPGALQVLAAGGDIDLDHVPAWVAELRSPEPVVIDDTRGRVDPWLLEKQRWLGDEGALIAVGMSTAGELVGVLGVSMAAGARHWTVDEITFLRIIGETVAHVFERARIDAALRASETRFRLLSETAADVVILLDATGTISYASPSCLGLLGFTAEEMIGRRTSSLVHPDHSHVLPAVGSWLASGQPLTSEGQLVRSDGSLVWVANSISAVIDPDTGLPIEFRTSMRDVTERKRLEAELERQALHDPLTGLANRILLQTRLAEATKTTSPDMDVAVLLLDLDGFKQVNDTYGHAVGDEVLRIVGARLTALTRPSDTLARTGGDEFVVLCPDTDVIGATLVGERIVEAVGKPIDVAGVTVHLGASVGVAHHAGPGANTDALLLEADKAMYSAKRSGRGRVAVAGPGPRTFVRSPFGHSLDP